MSTSLYTSLNNLLHATVSSPYEGREEENSLRKRRDILVSDRDS